MNIGKSMSRFAALLAAGIGTAFAPMPAAAAPIDILVPAYANPCCGGGPSMWSALIETAGSSARNFNLDVILNPASGPGSAVDPNYLNGSGGGPLNDLVAAGGFVYGYVPTNNGTRDIAAVKADINTYLNGFYAGYVSGIFFDEMSNDLANVGYYQELNAYVKALRPAARTMGNPGTTWVVGTGSATPADYLNAFDTLVTFENSGANYAGAYTSFPYLQGVDSKKIAHIVHTQAGWNPSLPALAASRGAGYLYVTDDVFVDPATDNPYDQLPTYWDTLVTGIEAFDGLPLPEPSSLLLVACALGVIGFLIRPKKPKPEPDPERRDTDA